MKKFLYILFAVATLTIALAPSYAQAAEAAPETKEQRLTLAEQAAWEIIQEEKFDTLTSDIEKVKAVHDYLVLNCQYDIEGYNQWAAGLIKDVTELDHEAYGVFYNKVAVCDGYSRAFQMMMNKLGVPCEIVIGYAKRGSVTVGHAWNIVTLNGERYHIDTTWDDPMPDRAGSVQYTYFLLDDEAMKADHTWNAEKVNACDGSKYRMYAYEIQGFLANSVKEMQKLMKTQFNEGNAGKFNIKVLIPETVKKSQVFNYLEKIQGTKNVREYYYTEPVQVGSYTYYHVWTAN